MGIKRSGKKFQYKKKDVSTYRKQASQSGSAFDAPFKDGVTIFAPKEGSYTVRIMPPTWDDAEYHGYVIYMHYSIGADNSSYVCPDKMLGERCPICEERDRASAEGDEEYAQQLKPTKRIAVWIIDRDKEKEGPKLWTMPWTLDKDIAERCIDRRSQEVLEIDNPDEGHDLDFTREGSGLRTKYIGVNVSPRTTPLSDDEDQQEEWLDMIIETPIPDVLQVYDYEHIAKVLHGTAPSRRDEDDDDDDDDYTEDDDTLDEDEDEDEGPPFDEEGGEDEDEDEDEDEPEPEPEPKPRRRRRAAVEEKSDSKEKSGGGKSRAALLREKMRRRK